MEKKKVLLILVDGMRPDKLAEIPYVQKMQAEGTSTLAARTVMPSVTLPCHMSLFHSVPTDRHGITTNTYTPMVRPLNGICEQLYLHKKKCGMCLGWEQLKDLSMPGVLYRSDFMAGSKIGYERVNHELTTRALEFIREDGLDFIFLYLGWVDLAGHNSGWLSEDYYTAVKGSWDEIERITEQLPEDYVVIVTADHGGHDRGHGADQDSDMIIPLFFKGEGIPAGVTLENAGIMDIAPTIAALVGVEPAEEWEGRNLLA